LSIRAVWFSVTAILALESSSVETPEHGFTENGCGKGAKDHESAIPTHILTELFIAGHNHDGQLTVSIVTPDKTKDRLDMKILFSKIQEEYVVLLFCIREALT
jgi:hypothetical protein